MPNPGILEYFKVLSSSPEEREWRVEMLIKGKTIEGTTDTRIALTVLATALLGRKEKMVPPLYEGWPVEVEVEKDQQVPAVYWIRKVRVRDDREEICKNIAPYVGKVKVEPLSPTAFVDETPPKWGFFFHHGNQNCAELKGTSLDIYAVVEAAWRQRGMVELDLDGDNLIVGARQVSPSKAIT